VDGRTRVEQLDGHRQLIYFDVVFAAREPPNEPFWPIRFTAGFH
jgi:hypothetical protein